jgi:hypothetical protein
MENYICQLELIRNHPRKRYGFPREKLYHDNVPVDDGDAAVVYESMYAANQAQGIWKPKANKAAIKLNEELLATASHRSSEDGALCARERSLRQRGKRLRR